MKNTILPYRPDLYLENPPRVICDSVETLGGLDESRNVKQEMPYVLNEKIEYSKRIER